MHHFAEVRFPQSGQRSGFEGAAVRDPFSGQVRDAMRCRMLRKKSRRS